MIGVVIVADAGEGEVSRLLEIVAFVTGVTDSIVVKVAAPSAEVVVSVCSLTIVVSVTG